MRFLCAGIRTRVVTLMLTQPCPFSRAAEAQSERHPRGKERLVGQIQELQEASEFPKKQAEAEGESESTPQQEASRLSLENRVRSRVTACAVWEAHHLQSDTHSCDRPSVRAPYVLTSQAGGCGLIKLSGGVLAIPSTAQSGHGSEYP